MMHMGAMVIIPTSCQSKGHHLPRVLTTATALLWWAASDWNQSQDWEVETPHLCIHLCCLACPGGDDGRWLGIFQMDLAFATWCHTPSSSSSLPIASVGMALGISVTFLIRKTFFMERRCWPPHPGPLLSHTGLGSAMLELRARVKKNSKKYWYQSNAQLLHGRIILLT